MEMAQFHCFAFQNVFVVGIFAVGGLGGGPSGRSAGAWILCASKCVLICVLCILRRRECATATVSVPLSCSILLHLLALLAV